MPQKIILDHKEFILTHRTNKRIKKVSLLLNRPNEIIVRTPLKFKPHYIKEIVYEHQDWIVKTFANLKPLNRFDFITGGQVPFLGKNYTIKLLEDDTIKSVKFVLDDDIFYIYHHKTANYTDFIDGLKQFYKYNAKKIINPIFETLVEKTDLIPNKISYRDAKTRWGSCSYKNNISINYRLLQFDKEIISYVVLHELCHIKEKNHSKRFWNLVSFYMPNYKELRSELKDKIF